MAKRTQQGVIEKRRRQTSQAKKQHKLSHLSFISITMSCPLSTYSVVGKLLLEAAPYSLCAADDQADAEAGDQERLLTHRNFLSRLATGLPSTDPDPPERGRSFGCDSQPSLRIPYSSYCHTTPSEGQGCELSCRALSSDIL